MAKKRKETLAEELYSQFELLSNDEQQAFCLRLMNDHKQLFGKLNKNLEELLLYDNKVKDYWLDALRLLSKHRKPKRNFHRDQEIVTHNSDGKTAGQIVLLMKSRHPALTDKIVNRVLSTYRARLRKQATTQ